MSLNFVLQFLNNIIRIQKNNWIKQSWNSANDFITPVNIRTRIYMYMAKATLQLPGDR